MKINYQNSKLALIAGSKNQFPKDDLAKIVIAGKSNVGKSSLLNALCNNKNLARTSQSPGKTRQIIFYNIDQKFYLVDLPGYGYAKTSQKEKAKFSNLTNDFIETEEIHLFIQLLDIRHKPTADDIAMLDWLAHSGIPYVIVLTKADKLKKTRVKPQVELLKDVLATTMGEDFQPIIVSAEKKTGLDPLKSAILTVLE